jgi:GDP-L-fucose synthase
MDSNSKIFVAGHNGLVGSAIVRKLRSEGYNNLLLIPSKECDLTNQEAVENLFAIHKPEYVFLAAAKVGGIMANSQYKADFITDNILIQTNVISSSHRHGVKKLLFLGSSCIYPKYANIPITEDQLMTGLLEPTNDAYAVAKIAGIKMCQSYREQYGFNAISLMPTNLYGPNDNFDLNSSHVLPALIRKIHESHINGSIPLFWGDGSPMREFLHVDDLANACLFLMLNYNDPEIINVGTGEDVTIKELVKVIREVIGYSGDIAWDTTKPNGTPRKVMNVDKIKSLGWKPEIGLEEGIKQTYQWFISRVNIK